MWTGSGEKEEAKVRVVEFGVFGEGSR